VIVFDLGCENGHVFEAWFGSSDDYEDQRRRGLLSCPICESKAVDKAAMAPRLTRKGNQLLGPTPPSNPIPSQAPAMPTPMPSAKPSGSVPVANEMPSPTQVKEMMQVLAKAQTEMLKQSDYVGTRFADEARSIHLGDSKQRAIHGQTTPEEARALVDEGIAVAPLPFPVRPPSADN
jgi:hypothetical protein